ncbi:MAG: 5'/3'-nucleotidase SurE [Clostridia bacterium]|nr:5'/3'-nucleotidase SurE [Clostridia bacterium]
MRILITNDDSISASQLLPLAHHCQKYGEVTIAVPKFEQSAKSHSIELRSAFSVEKKQIEGITTFVVDSSPADCVRYAVLGLETRYDLIISGINIGLNMGTDMLYSGTVAAIEEAAILKIPAIALSTTPENYGNVIGQLDEVFDYVFSNKLLNIHPLYNINIPANPKGIKITRQGGVFFSDSFVNTEGNLYKASGRCAYEPSDDLTLDTDAVMSGYISVLPLTINMTDLKVFEQLTK